MTSADTRPAMRCGYNAFFPSQPHVGLAQPRFHHLKFFARMQNRLVLRVPREDEEAEFLRAHRATSPEVPNFLHYYQEGMPFRRYLDVLGEQERGENLPPDHVPSTFLFAFAGP